MSFCGETMASILKPQDSLTNLIKVKGGNEIPLNRTLYMTSDIKDILWWQIIGSALSVSVHVGSQIRTFTSHKSYLHRSVLYFHVEGTQHVKCTTSSPIELV